MARYLTLRLTFPEARGLLALARDGAAGILSDPVSCRDILGDQRQQDAAVRGLQKLADTFPVEGHLRRGKESRSAN